MRVSKFLFEIVSRKLFMLTNFLCFVFCVPGVSSAKDINFIIEIDYTCQAPGTTTVCDNTTENFAYTGFVADNDPNINNGTNLTKRNNDSPDGIFFELNIAGYSLKSEDLSVTCVNGQDVTFSPAAIFTTNWPQKWKHSFGCEKLRLTDNSAKWPANLIMENRLQGRGSISGTVGINRRKVNGSFQINSWPNHTKVKTYEAAVFLGQPALTKKVIDSAWDSCQLSGVAFTAAPETSSRTNFYSCDVDEKPGLYILEVGNGALLTTCKMRCVGVLEPKK